MALYHRSSEKKRICHDFGRQEEEVIGSLCRLGSRPISPKTQLEQEKRIRREIANSNERRRMQSINAGFQSLRTLLPHHEGEKLSKAAILQHTAEYIYQLEQEKTRLLSQNCQLKRLISSQMNHDSDGSNSDSPLPKRKKTETVESSDEGIGSMSPSESEPGIDDLKREMIELRVQLDRERKLRMILEEQTRTLEAQLYPERIREIAHQVQLQYQHHPDKTGDSQNSLQLHNSFLETRLSSPQSHMSSEEIETSQEAIIVKQSPKHNVEVPQDLSGKGISILRTDTALPSPFASVSDPVVNHQTQPSLVLPQPQQASSPPPPQPTPALPSPVVPEPVAQPALHIYPASTSRQNLETIVEAIRHLEGDHLFCDDPEPPKQENSGTLPSVETNTILNITSSIKSEPSQTTEHRSSHSSSSSCMSTKYTMRQHIIQSAPLSQSRPGVIVANHS